ncbi:MAG: GNAT family N-acetyltransferase [Sphingomonas bacterium]|nr:GNAT family N-acetyltransferase [Sphingomonas bacterium]
MSLIDVPAGQLAAVVSYLEMRAPPLKHALPASPLELHRIEDPAPAAYRELFRQVGAPWLWFSRLIMPDAALAAILDHPGVELFDVRDGDAVVGMLELDRRSAGQCELAFVGLIPAYAGQGHGRWLLAEAIERAWSGDAVERVHVHTCSLDHPAALNAYCRAGFVAVRRKVETFIDPRLADILPRGTAPQVPLLDPSLDSASS